MAFSESDILGGIAIPDDDKNVVFTGRCGDLKDLPVGLYHVVVDLENDKVVVTNRKIEKCWKLLTDVLICEDTKKERDAAERYVCRNLQKLKILCRSDVEEKFGKRFANNAPVWRIAFAPELAVAGMVRLYISDSMEYLHSLTKPYIKI